MDFHSTLRKMMAVSVLMALGTFPLLAGCRGLVRDDLGQAADPVAGLDPAGMDILRLAALAPSGHNTQPWGIRIVAPDTWIIQSDERRWLPAVDPDQRETLLSIGAFVETLIQAAQAHGLEADLESLATSAQDRDIVRVRLRRTGSPGNDAPAIVERIEKRQTVRCG